MKAKNPTERVKDDNEPLYYQMRDMFNSLVEKKYSDATLYFYINKTTYKIKAAYRKEVFLKIKENNNSIEIVEEYIKIEE